MEMNIQLKLNTCVLAQAPPSTREQNDGSKMGGGVDSTLLVFCSVVKKSSDNHISKYMTFPTLLSADTI